MSLKVIVKKIFSDGTLCVWDCNTDLEDLQYNSTRPKKSKISNGEKDSDDELYENRLEKDPEDLDKNLVDKGILHKLLHKLNTY